MEVRRVWPLTDLPGAAAAHQLTGVTVTGGKVFGTADSRNSEFGVYWQRPAATSPTGTKLTPHRIGNFVTITNSDAAGDLVGTYRGSSWNGPLVLMTRTGRFYRLPPVHVDIDIDNRRLQVTMTDAGQVMFTSAADRLPHLMTCPL